jgi:elongation factor Ts
MEVTAEMVKQLREKTGLGILDCKTALKEAKGDVNKAVEILRKKGMKTAEGKQHRQTNQGLIESYVHVGGKIGVLVEINCETDFVARNEDFQTFAKDITMHICASNPRFLDQQSVPEDVIEKEKEIFRELALKEGKPEKIVDKIAEGRLKKFFEENCLLQQPFIKDQEKSVQAVLDELIGKIRENIKIRRFIRFELGEEIG